MPRWLRGLDDMVFETAYLGVSALVAIVVFAYALGSPPARALEGVPLLGSGIRALRSLVAAVANP